MPRAKKVTEVTSEAIPAATERVSVDVHDEHDRFVRSYSMDMHGERFLALASEYAAKIGGSVR